MNTGPEDKINRYGIEPQDRLDKTRQLNNLLSKWETLEYTCL